MNLSNEAKLGISIFVAALILASGIIYLKGIDLRTQEYSFTIYYDNVIGLTEGSPITVAGLAIGKVASMTLEGNTIAVGVSIQKQVQLSKDSKAFIKSASIMGGKFIAIIPGIQTSMLQDGDRIIGSYEADLTELTATLAPITSNVLGILENVNTTFDEKTRLHMKAIVADVNRSTAQLDELIRVEAKRLDFAIENFAGFSANLSKFARRLDTIAVSQRSNIDTSLVAIRRLAVNLDHATANLRSTTASLDIILGKMKDGEGTFGKLVHEEQLYNNLDSLAFNLNTLVKDLKENPGKYVKLSLF